MSAMAAPFDPRETFDKARAPVAVEIGGHGHRGAIPIMMGGEVRAVLRRSHGKAARIPPGPVGVAVEATPAPDTAERAADPPDQLARAPGAVRGGRDTAEPIGDAERPGPGR